MMGMEMENVGGGEPALKEQKNAVSVIYEMYRETTCKVVAQEGLIHDPVFTVALEINGKEFMGQGRTKKEAKHAAATNALATMNFTRDIPVETDNVEIPQVFADHVSNVVTHKFNQLLVNDKAHSSRKVLAGLVMSMGWDLATCRVVAVSTGNKCINGEHLSLNGATVHDSHAEIVARRCFKRFLHKQLKMHLESDNVNESIFLPFESTNGFQLKTGIKFHMYISTAPCGDGRLFSQHDDDSEDMHPNRYCRGKLRTKIECGEGTIPVKSDEPIQTWDGIIQGERLLTMSCSDKLARWNIVGLQGTLLSRFVAPIYLESIILGSLFHPSHLHRAVIGRVQNCIQDLPPPYHINVPKMGVISSKEVRNTVKAPKFSVNWTDGDSCIEVVNASTGKTESDQISRLAKRALFQEFMELVQSASFGKDDPSLKDKRLSYREWKELSTGYQAVKSKFCDALATAGKGRWVKMPAETEQFVLPSDGKAS